MGNIGLYVVKERKVIVVSDEILKIENLSKSFKNEGKSFQAVKNVSFNINYGEVLGLVGESGCGKSTIAKLITGLETLDEGSITICGQKIDRTSIKSIKECYKYMKMIFQEPRSSFDSRLTIGESIRETLKCYKKMSKEQYKEKSVELLKIVGLEESYDNLKPLDISGGECQRAAIARAIATNPKLLICDECTSALDVSVQAQIMELLQNMKSSEDMGILFISHDLALVSSFCDRLCVMNNGEIVETGVTSELIKNPKNDYTKLLLASLL